MSDSKTDIVLEKVIELIKANYAPALTIDKADYMPSTSDLYTKIQEFYPANYTAASLVTMLVSAGYRFAEVEFNFVWLLKEI